MIQVRPRNLLTNYLSTGAGAGAGKGRDEVVWCGESEMVPSLLVACKKNNTLNDLLLLLLLFEGG